MSGQRAYAVSAVGICSFRNGSVQRVWRGQGKSVWAGPEVCQDVAQGHTNKYCVTLSKSPTLSLTLRFLNMETMPKLLPHWDWVLKPLGFLGCVCYEHFPGCSATTKMVIENTDVTRDILSRKELLLGTHISWWEFSEHGPASQHSQHPQRALMWVINTDQLLPFR